MNIMQGDAYSIPITITTADGTLIDDTMVDAVEVVIGFLKKTYPEEITFSDGKWLFPLTQEESFKLSSYQQTVQVRVKFNSGEVVGAVIGSVPITASVSKEVL